MDHSAVLRRWRRWTSRTEKKEGDGRLWYDRGDYRCHGNHGHKGSPREGRQSCTNEQTNKRRASPVYASCRNPTEESKVETESTDVFSVVVVVVHCESAVWIERMCVDICVS